MEYLVRLPPADRRVDPVPCGGGHEDVEASTTVVPPLKVDVSTVTSQKSASRWRASVAIPAPGSMAVTEHPRAASDRVA
jgi:hypothetical protein